MTYDDWLADEPQELEQCDVCGRTLTRRNSREDSVICRKCRYDLVERPEIGEEHDHDHVD